VTGTRTSDVPTCTLRIGELVLHGFAGVDRYAVSDAIERELGRLLGSGESWQALTAHGKTADGRRIDAGRVSIAAGATPETVGIQIARAIHGGVTASDGGTRSARPESPRAMPSPGGSGGTT
jgi:hypothetical protein